MVPGLWLNEGGQSATGALLDHVIFTHKAAGEEFLFCCSAVFRDGIFFSIRTTLFCCLLFCFVRWIWGQFPPFWFVDEYQGFKAQMVAYGGLSNI
jgi:hypothetical protein